MIDADAPMGTEWLRTAIPPYIQIGDKTCAWAQAILWGNRKVYGANLMKDQRVEFDAVTADEELVERITFVRAIALISLPLPHQAAPCRVNRREAP